MGRERLRLQCTHLSHSPMGWVLGQKERASDRKKDRQTERERERDSVESHHLRVIYPAHVQVSHRGLGSLWTLCGNCNSANDTHTHKNAHTHRSAACQNLSSVPSSGPLKSKTNSLITRMPINPTERHTQQPSSTFTGLPHLPSITKYSVGR